jgi:probable HAF family extracellular repeat protein
MVLLLCTTQAQTASFRWLGEQGSMGSPATLAYDVSDDGTVVVGQSGSREADLVVGVWSKRQDPICQGWPPLEASAVTGVSADGYTIIGWEWWRSFRCNQVDGFEFIINEGTANDISTDGTSVVGGEGLGSPQAFLWTQSSGTVGLGYLIGDDFSSATGISADGSVIVGYSGCYTTNTEKAFRWSQNTGIVELGDLPGGNTESRAHGVSADGVVVVGSSSSELGIEAFRWTQTDGMVGLGILPGKLSSVALGTSGDGSVVIGMNSSYSDPYTSMRFKEAFVWDKIKGMRSLKNELTEVYGIDLTGWNLGNVKQSHLMVPK